MMASNQENHDDDQMEKQKAMKKYRKEMTKVSEAAGNMVRCGLSLGAEEAEEAINKIASTVDFKFSKGTSAIVKQHKSAQQEGEIEFLANYLKSQLGINDRDKDPYGNGDQSRLKGYAAMKLRTQWATGFDYNPANNRKLSDWCKVCFYADIEGVQRYINGIVTDEDKMKLLERRESMIRFCGILHVICGARMDPSSNHVKVAKLLIDAGCKLDAKDVAGYMPLHHCLTQYGNSTTLQIAHLLVENGANVNASNRFGCTPLFEPCMNFNYEFIEFLVCNGADPAMKDNDGVSCQTISTHNPRIVSLFSKGYRAMAKNERAQAASGADGAEGKEGDALCDYCRSSGKLSKCSGCMSVRYCSRACQTYDWKEHKPKCKVLQKQRNAEGEMVYVKPVANPYGEEIVMFNEKTKKVEVTGKGNNKKQFMGAEKAMKVKIQVSLGHDGPTVKEPMLVYNKDRSYKCYILVEDANFKAVYKKVLEKGYGGIKAYFAATLKKNGDLQINLSTTYPETF